MNAPIEIKQIKTEGAVHFVFARREFAEQLFQNSRIALAHAVEFADMLACVGLDLSFRRRLLNELPCFDSSERRDFEAREVVEILPDMPDLLRPVRATRDPDWNLFAQLRDETRDPRRSVKRVIKRDRFTATLQVKEQTVFPFDHVELATSPAELEFKAIADSAQARCFFAN